MDELQTPTLRAPLRSLPAPVETKVWDPLVYNKVKEYYQPGVVHGRAGTAPDVEVQRSGEEGFWPCVCHDGALWSNWKQTPRNLRAALGNHEGSVPLDSPGATICVPPALCVVTLARTANAAGAPTRRGPSASLAAGPGVRLPRAPGWSLVPKGEPDAHPDAHRMRRKEASKHKDIGKGQHCGRLHGSAVTTGHEWKLS